MRRLKIVIRGWFFAFSVLLAVAAFLSVAPWRVSAQQQQTLQGQIQRNINPPPGLAAQLAADWSDCLNPRTGGGMACMALSLQVNGINKDHGCLSYIVPAIANSVAIRKLYYTQPRSSQEAAAIAQQIRQLSATQQGLVSALGSRGCFNPNPGRPNPVANTNQKPFACQAYWNSWYVHTVGECNSSRGCIDQANATVKRGLAQCSGQIAGQPSSNTSQSPPRTRLSFRNQLLLYSQIILQAAGKIAKANIEAMDVTKHNDVGIGVAITSYFGAMGKLLGFIGQEYRAIALANAAGQDGNAILTMAAESAKESQVLAGQASQTVGQLDALGSTTVGMMQRGTYNEGAVLIGQTSQLLKQSDLPTCTVLSCYKLATLIGRNTSMFQVLNKIRPLRSPVTVTLTPVGNEVVGTVSGGISLQEAQAGLQSLGIPAQIESGLPNLVNQVKAGRPAIVAVRTTMPAVTASTIGQAAKPVDVTLHAMVVEGAETRAGVLGLKIYDPYGEYYWQPLYSFNKYFTGAFLTAQ